MSRFQPSRFVYLGLSFLIFTLDQWTKWMVAHRLTLYESVVVIPGFFNLTYIHNRGVIFGLFSDVTNPFLQTLILVLSVLSFILIAIFFFFIHHESRWASIGFAFVLGGALGNTWDRVTQGYVIDFLDFYYGPYHWPSFNIADAAISIGVGMLILHMLGAQWHAGRVQSSEEDRNQFPEPGKEVAGS